MGSAQSTPAASSSSPSDDAWETFLEECLEIMQGLVP